MTRLEEIIHQASLVGPKTKNEKEFRQVWFTRPEVMAVAKLVMDECASWIAENGGISDEADLIALKKHLGVK